MFACVRLGRQLLPTLFGAALVAQRGDRPDEVQTPLPDHLVVPPATVHEPAAELATFRVQPGFAVELFAAEPLVADPVAAAFDLAGRLWVVEMRGYMNDLEASNERAPVGRIAILRDHDGDGRADAATTFLDGLVLPRAVLPLRGGALVIAPPELCWCPDADGDLVADGKVVLAGGFEAGLENPEHSGNGLLWSFDHRIHLANDQRLLQWTPSGFLVTSGAGGGQWGIAHDDRGRLYFNYNEDWLRCDLVPGRHGPAAARCGGLPLLNHRVVPERTVWPIRITPGVNRGYQPGRLVDWVLAIHTAVCAPHVYRGGWLPDCDGDVFVCEPAGNLVRRFVLRDVDGAMGAGNPYEAERQEFLASTDERFRPVNLLTGPDGALWVVDMYRGVIQHRNFVTTFLRRQIEQRGLQQPTGLGRIWRVVPREAAPSPPAVSLPDATIPELVVALSHRNGLWRDLALRDLVQREARGAVPALRTLCAESTRPAVHIAALSALAGLRALSATELRAALRARDPGVVNFALQHVASFVAAGDGHLWLALERLAGHPAPAVRWHVALALGDVLAVRQDARAEARAAAVWQQLVVADPADARLRAAVATAAPPRVLLRLVGDLAAALAAAPRGDEVLRDLAARLVRSREIPLLAELFALAAGAPESSARRALLQGAVEALPKGAARIGWLHFAATPPALVAAAASPDAATAALARELLAAIAVTGETPRAAGDALTPEEVARVASGESTFRRACAACHQLDGNGMQGLAPPLRDSEWVLGAADVLVRIALHGVKGPIAVNGSTWSLEMPGQRHLGDEELAGVLSYLRRAFGHRRDPIAKQLVADVRAAHRQRQEPWTAEELLGGK